MNVLKRIAIWAFYAAGALAIGYLALFAYATYTGRAITPGDPIRIFRKPDAPSYSRMAPSSFRGARSASRESIVHRTPS